MKSLELRKIKKKKKKKKKKKNYPEYMGDGDGGGFGYDGSSSSSSSSSSRSITTTTIGDDSSSGVSVNQPQRKKQKREKQKRRWTEEEDKLLCEKVKNYENLTKKPDGGMWIYVAESLDKDGYKRNENACRKHFRSLGYERGTFRKEEKDTLLVLVKELGDKNWTQVSTNFSAKMNELFPNLKATKRAVKQCLETCQQIAEKYNHDKNWTKDEDRKIVDMKENQNMTFPVIAAHSFFYWFSAKSKNFLLIFDILNSENMVS